MTAAFNLSQLANNLNTSGQLDATDGLTGAVPVANGGTGSTTAAGARANLGTNDAANITTGTISTARLGSGTANSTTFLRGDNTWATAGGTPTTNQVLSATAGASAGEIGTYALLGRDASGSLSFGSTYAGSGLFACGIGAPDGSGWGTSSIFSVVGSGSGGFARSGTWRCMGNFFAGSSPAATVFLRIS